MTEERQKLANLPKEERDQLIKEAQSVGLKSTVIANWYVDTLHTKIEELKQKQADSKPTPPENKPDTKNETQENKPEEKKPTPPAKENKKATADVVKICHICRGKVINGKCTQCGFEIAKR